MKTIFLHIGRGKTGTTFLQRFLATNRAALLDQGFDYLLADDGGRGVGHQQFAKSFISRLPELMEPAQNPDEVRRQVYDQVLKSRASNILISSENFPLADLTALHAFFADVPEPLEVKIILFVRSQDELAESEYNQLIKLKPVSCSFAEYVHKHLEDVDYFALATDWVNHFGVQNFFTRVYDGVRADVVAQFLSILPGVETDMSRYSLPDREAQNASLGLRALTVLRMLNGTGLEDRTPLYENIIRALSTDDMPALFFDSASAANFRNSFADSNRAFSRTFLGREVADLGGRRYSDSVRDALRTRITDLRLDRY